MTYDFRADQIRTNRLIASGSTGTNSRIMIYPVAVAADTSGGILPSLVTSSIGQDVFMFVSGAVNSMNTPNYGVTLFGGDLVASGAFRAYGTIYTNEALIVSTSLTSLGTSMFIGAINALSSGTIGGPFQTNGTFKAAGGISGSHTKLTDGTSYLVAGDGIAIMSQSNGSIIISSSVTSSAGLPSGSNGGVLAYSTDAWSTTDAGTLGQVLISSGSGKALFSNSVVPLRVGTPVAIPSDSALALGWAYRSIVVRDSGNTSWLDVWRADGSSYWVYGTTNGTYTNGLILTLPSSGQFFLTRGSSNHITINGSGILTLGTTTHSTVLRGSALTIGLTAVVATYQGGARIPEVTISGNTTFDTSTEMVFVDTISTVVTGTLPAGAGGRIISVQKVTGSNNYVIAVTSPDTIRVAGSGSATTWTITDTFRHSLVYRSFGTEWVVEY